MNLVPVKAAEAPRKFDLAIIGAGPTGMAAAITARECGLSVLVVDENAAPGGQVFRAAELAGADPALARDMAPGLELIARFRALDITYRPGTTLWMLEPDTGTLSLARQGETMEVTAERILLATGAQERPVPVPGWTLPGVMSAGAAQIALKTADVVARQSIDPRGCHAGTGGNAHPAHSAHGAGGRRHLARLWPACERGWPDPEGASGRDADDLGCAAFARGRLGPRAGAAL
jgi:hypothetical protein